jgi:hypothetical protein
MEWPWTELATVCSDYGLGLSWTGLAIVWADHVWSSHGVAWTEMAMGWAVHGLG